MTLLPGIEARISAQERMSALLHARIEELSQDMTTSFQQLAKYHTLTERELDIRFKHIDVRLDRIESIMATKEDLIFLEGRIIKDIASLEGRIKENVTSLEGRIKEDIASLGSRMTTLEQRFTAQEGKIDNLEQRFTAQEGKFDQVLQMLATLTKKIAE